MTLADQVRKIRNSLLPSTLEYAVSESRYYRRMLSDRYREVKTVEDLGCLPILDKQTMIANLEEILCHPQPDDLISFTSGTTGEILTVRRSRSECEELRKCWELLIERNRSKSVTQPLILEIYNVHHGLPIFPPPSNVIRIPEHHEHEGYYLWIKELLSSSFDFPGVEPQISVIRSSLTALRYLTLYFLQQDIRPCSFGIKKIATSGIYVSNRWRTFLAEQWQASIVDTYSLSEFASNGAVQCELCGYNHFVLPTLVPEIVNPVTYQPIESGIGLLVLTSLYPFSQRQPFIRYSTGDLVERGPRCVRDDVGFRIRGRMSQSLLLTETDGLNPLILSLDVYDVLDSLPDVNRSYSAALRLGPGFLSPDLTRTVLPPSVRYTLQSLLDNRHVIQFEVGLNYMPELYPDRIDELSEYIVSALCARNPYLAEAIDEGSVEMSIRFLPPYAPLPTMQI